MLIRCMAKELSAFKEESSKFYALANDINERYLKAVAENNTEEAAAIQQEGIAYNLKVHEVFKAVQDDFIGIEASSTIVNKHTGYQDNLEVLDGVIAALEQGVLSNEEETGALDLAYLLNGVVEYNYYIFSPSAALMNENHTNKAADGFKWWGQNKCFYSTNTGFATASLVSKAEEESPDFTEELNVYRASRAEQLKYFAEEVDKEIAAMASIVELMK